MIKLNEFVDDYIGKHQIGYADALISDYIMTEQLEYSNYENIKHKIEKILLKKSNISFSKTTGKYIIIDGEYKNPVISKLQNYECLIIGRLSGNNDQIKLDKISHNEIKIFLNDYEFDNIDIYENLIIINCKFEEISISINISKRDFQIRTRFLPNSKVLFPFLNFLKGKNEYILNKKGYLPLDSILYISFIKIRNLLNSIYKEIDLKIDLYDHIQ